MTNDEAVKRLREQHFERPSTSNDGSFCPWDGEAWPCSVATLLADRDALQQRAEAAERERDNLRAALNQMGDMYQGMTETAAKNIRGRQQAEAEATRWREQVAALQVVLEHNDHLAVCRAALAALDAPPAEREHESPASIQAWLAEHVPDFPDTKAWLERADEEYLELREAFKRQDWQHALEEAADVTIVFVTNPALWEAVERKMAINRQRQWRVADNGHIYHVKPATPDAESES